MAFFLYGELILIYSFISGYQTKLNIDFLYISNVRQNSNKLKLNINLIVNNIFK